MFGSMTSRLSVALGSACLIVLLMSSAAPAQVGRVWTYADNNGGYFENTGGNRWVEFVNNDGGVVFQFREITRNADYVLLYDESRNLWVRLHETTSYIRHSGTGGWVFLYNGRWS